MAHALLTIVTERSPPNVSGFVLVSTGKFDLNPNTCGREHYWFRKEKLRIKKYPDMCGWGLINYNSVFSKVLALS